MCAGAQKIWVSEDILSIVVRGRAPGVADTFQKSSPGGDMSENKDSMATSSLDFAMSEGIRNEESAAQAMPTGRMKAESRSNGLNAVNSGMNQRYIEYSDVYSRFYPREQGR